jgi:hypothetical protein
MYQNLNYHVKNFVLKIFIKKEIFLAKHPNQTEFLEPITAMTINRLEEQIQMLRIKVEDINARLENVTSILQETHPGNVKIFQL